MDKNRGQLIAMRHILLYLIVLSALLSSCVRNAPSEICTIEVPVNNIEEGDVATFLEYRHHVVLETTDASLLGDICKIQLYDGIYYILSNEKVYRFAADGSFVGMIDRRGKGGSEYLTLNDFYCADGYIYLCDRQSRKVLKGTVDGSDWSSFGVRPGCEFIGLTSGDWLFYAGNGAASKNKGERFYDNVFRYDSEWQFKDSYLPFNPLLLGRSYNVGTLHPAFSRYGDEVYYLDALGNCIYRYDVESSSLKAEYQIVFEGFNPKFLSNPELDDAAFKALIRSMLNLETPAYVNNFYLSGDKMLFSYLYKGSRATSWCVYDLVEGKSLVYDVWSDENGLPIEPASFLGNDNDEFLALMDASVFSRCYKQLSADNPVVQSLSPLLSQENSNPVLLFYHVR